VGGDGGGLDAGGFRGGARTGFFVFEGGAYEGCEERVRLERLGLELGVKLAAEKPRMLGGFDDLDVIFVGGAAGDEQAGVGQSFLVVAIEFVAVAVAFADFRFAVGAIR